MMQRFSDASQKRRKKPRFAEVSLTDRSDPNDENAFFRADDLAHLDVEHSHPGGRHPGGVVGLSFAERRLRRPGEERGEHEGG